MIYEFLYRGPTDTNNRKGAWHVIIAEEATAFGQTKLHTLGPLTPAIAEDHGFKLTDIFAEINAEAMKTADANAAQIEEMQALADKQRDDINFRDEAIKAITTDKVVLQNRVADLEKQLASALQSASDTQALLDAATTNVATMTKKYSVLSNMYKQAITPTQP